MAHEAIKKTLRIRQENNSTDNSITSEQVDLDTLAKEIDLFLREKGFSPMPEGGIKRFLESVVRNHNEMTRDIVAFWCPKLLPQL
jgi:hypothetical protein